MAFMVVKSIKKEITVTVFESTYRNQESEDGFQKYEELF